MEVSGQLHAIEHNSEIILFTSTTNKHVKTVTLKLTQENSWNFQRT